MSAPNRSIHPGTHVRRAPLSNFLNGRAITKMPSGSKVFSVPILKFSICVPDDRKQVRCLKRARRYRPH